ncbi:MAG TPA: hypothetical protein VI248_28655 [Kineosporiaceae bacterium]
MTEAGVPAAGAVAVRHAEVERVVRSSCLSTATVSDVLDGLGIGNAVLPARLRRFCGGERMFHGSAYTVSWVPTRKGPDITAAGDSTWHQVRDFLVPDVEDGRGLVYVSGAGPLVTEAALAGGLSCTYFTAQLRFEGVVLGGAVRDAAAVGRLERAVVASNLVPADSQGAYRVDDVGGRCVIGSVLVTTGDWVFSDLNGTVLVPAERLDDVLDAAVGIESSERRISERVAAGERLPHVVDTIGRI